MLRTENARLETLAILFEAATFLTGAAFHMMVHRILFLKLRLLAYFRSESVRSALESLCNRFLADFLILQIVLARVAVATTRNTVVARSKALAVQFEAL